MLINNTKKVILLSYICIASVSAAIITPALPQIQHAFALTQGAVAWVVSIFLLGYVIGQLIYGPLANRFGRLSALRSGLSINLVGIIICLAAAYSCNYHLLLLGRFVTAIGAAAGLSCTFILINELLSPKVAKHILSFAMVAFTLGIGLAVLIGGVITQYYHWQGCFIVLLLHSLLMLLLTWQFPETLTEKKALHPIILIKGYYHAIKNAQLIIFSLAVGLCSAFAYCYAAAAPIIAQKVLSLSPSQYGYWNLINMFGMLGSGYLSAYLLKRYDTKKVLLASLFILIPCLVSLSLFATSNHPSTLWFFATSLALYLFSGVLFPCGSHLASNAITDKANAASMMSFINMGSAMLSVIIMGYLPFSHSFAFALVLIGFYLVVSLLIILQLLNTSKHFFDKNNKPISKNI
jgi:MFS transporter, DHA1 family, multidrug resistance protein